MGSNGIRRTGRRQPIYTAVAARAGPAPQTGGAPPAGPPEFSDKVSLSAAYRVIKKLETGVRIETLRLHVSRGAYWIPALKVSRSIVAECLAA